MWRNTVLFFSLIIYCTQLFATHWQKLASLDLTASYHYLKNDSAGGADSENSHYKTWLNTGYRHAEKMVTKITDASSYNLVMNYYINGFHDEHVQYVPYLQRFNFTESWPGFTVYFQDKHFYVSSIAYDKTAKGLPPKGAELLGCDKQPIRALLQQRVFPYFGNPSLNASWHIVTPRLFFYRNNPWFSPIKQCQFLINHTKKKYHLFWQSLTNTRAYHLRLQASYSYHGNFSVHSFNKKNMWVSIPSFLPKSSSHIQHLKDIIAQAATWRHKKIIVIDMRGNLGGNSVWGNKLLRALYGDTYYQQQTKRLNTAVYQWRASSDNIAELQGFYSHYIKRNFGINSQAYQQLQHTISGMKTALKEQHAYYPKTVIQPILAPINHTTKNPVSATIVFLTDGRCASSCLTFADHLFTFPNVIQAGQPTHAATDYTESVMVKLPSGARLYYPMKVQRFRQRKSNQAYYPDRKFYYLADINNTLKIQQWLRTRLNNW